MTRDEWRQCVATEVSLNSPPDTGGVAAALTKGGEAHLSAADGVVAFESTLCVSDHPVRSIKGGFASSLFMSRPPLLYQEGSWAKQQ